MLDLLTLGISITIVSLLVDGQNGYFSDTINASNLTSYSSMNLFSRITSKWSQLITNVSQLSSRQRNQYLQEPLENIRQTRQKYYYTEHPRLSMILQFFNKRQNIKRIIERLRLTTAEEIIIIDDGSIDGSYEEWMRYLDRPNDFLLRCNDLFEIRTYDRAMRMAKGEFVCLLQDDDIPPANNSWVEQALALFNLFPELIMLGGRNGIDMMMPKPAGTSEKQEYSQIGDIVECPGLHKLRIYGEPRYQEPSLGIPFMFTMAVNRAPTFLRKREFLKIGGINQNYAPFQFDDDEAGMRAWLGGYKVGLYSCPFVRGFDVGGMSLFNSNKIKEQSVINAKQLYADYSEYIANGHLQNLVDTANRSLTSQT